MSNWFKIKLGDYIDIITDYHANGAYEKLKENINLKYEPDYALMVRTVNFESNDFKSKNIYLNEREYNYLSKSKVEPYDIIMNKIANPGSVYLMPDLCRPVSLAMNLFLIRFNNKIDQRFIYYLMKFNETYIKRFANGTTTKSITKDAVRELSFKIPDLQIQKKITSLLSDLDAKIELNNKINAELEAIAKTLYDYWFVQFDFPCDFAQDKPDAKGKPYKSSGGKMVYNVELKREIPAGWEVKKIKEIAKTGSGGTPLKSKKEFYENGNIPWINSGEVNAPFIISTKKFITQKGLAGSSAKLFPKGTILMAMYGATAGQVSLTDIEACTNQAVCGIIPNDVRLVPYVKFELHQLYEYLISLSTGSARDNLSQDKIKELYIVIPQENVIEKFYKISNSSFKKTLINLKENQHLASLRDWLLPMLMNGQVRVGEIGVLREAQDDSLGMVAEPSEQYGKE